MTLRCRVPVTSDKMTGYPGSFPVGEAIYAHMTNYAVGPQCGPVRYRFAAAGSIATARALFDGVAPADADAPALLFLARRSRDGSPDYIDPALSAAAVAQIHRVADDTAALLRERLPGMEFKRRITATSVLVGTLPACRTIRRDLVVERVEGVSLFGDTASLPAMVATRRARGAVTLGIKDGSALAVPCRTPYQPLPYFYAAGMQKIMQRLQPWAPGSTGNSGG